MKLDLNQVGLKLIVKALPKYARFECAGGDATFSLHASDEAGSGNTWLYFETESLDDDVRKLQDKGVVSESLPTDQTWLWREALLKDPDGNQFILYHAGRNRKDPPWRFRY